MFDGQLQDIAIASLRVLFRLDYDLATTVEDSLVEHGGAECWRVVDVGASSSSIPGNGARKELDVYERFYSGRQCWASKCRGL
jgi:hypothetical protein